MEVGMRGISVSEKYRGIKSDGIIFRGLAKYRLCWEGRSERPKLMANISRTIGPILSRFRLLAQKGLKFL